jgi:hypothetical protein
MRGEKEGRTKRVKFFGPSSHGVIVVLERGEEKGIEQEVFPPMSAIFTGKCKRGVGREGREIGREGGK